MIPRRAVFHERRELTRSVTHTATAQGIIAQLRILGGSIGIAASTAILAAKTRAQLSGILSPAQLSNLAANEATLTPVQYKAVRIVYTDSLEDEMKVCFGILLVALIFTLGVYRRNRISLDDTMRVRELEEEARLLALREPPPPPLPPRPAGV